MYTNEFSDIIRRHLKRLEPVDTGMEARTLPYGKTEAVMFDIYGTLIISGSGDIEADSTGAGTGAQARIRDLLKRHGIDKEPEQIRMEIMETVKQEHAVLKRRGIDIPEVRYEDFWQRITGLNDQAALMRLTLEYEMIVNPVSIMPHAPIILRQLKDRNVVLGIISNAQFFTIHILSELLGCDLRDAGFVPDLMFFSYEHGCAKPSPRLFGKAVQALSEKGITPERVLYVGNDMRSDVFPAHDAGFRTALFAGDKRSLRLRGAAINDLNEIPDNIITDLNQVYDCL